MFIHNLNFKKGKQNLSFYLNCISVHKDIVQAYFISVCSWFSYMLTFIFIFSFWHVPILIEKHVHLLQFQKSKPINWFCPLQILSTTVQQSKFIWHLINVFTFTLSYIVYDVHWCHLTTLAIPVDADLLILQLYLFARGWKTKLYC